LSDGERDRFIDRLVSNGYLKSERVIKAFGSVPRHLFVPEEIRDVAYDDCPQPIGFNQTISAPHMVAIMTELLDVRPDSGILEVGTGSGYQAAILAELAPQGLVVSLERVPELADRAGRTLRELGYGNVRVVEGDGTLGFRECAPYDRILVTAAAPAVPKSLVGQLAAGGRLLVPVGGRWSQTLLEVDRDGRGRVSERSHGGCVFVPLIGREGW